MKLIKILIGVLVAGSSSLSLAVVDIQIEAGQNDSTYKYKDNLGTVSTVDPKIKSTDIGATVLFAPWKAPIGIGAAYTTSSGTGSEGNVDYGTSATKLSLALGAWVPSPIVKPFVNLKYLVSGDEDVEVKTKTTGAKATYKGTLSGYTAEVGIGYKFAPTFNLFLSYGMIAEEEKLKSIEAGTTSISLSNGEKFDITGSVISLGLGFSI